MLRSRFPYFWHWLTAFLLIGTPAVHSRPSKPTKRFQRWQAATPTIRSVALGLGYSELTWNYLNATIESTRYSNQPNAALNDINFLMGYEDEKERWDCWINHYLDYSWSGLDSKVRKNYETLGWDELRWTGIKVPPESATKDWDSLSDKEKEAAENLCFDKTTWELNPIPIQGASEAAANCFSGINKVEVQGKGLVEMEKLRIGDKVLGGRGQFSRIYSFSHFDPHREAVYLRIFVDNLSEPIEISTEHLIFVNGKMARAEEVEEGDMLGDFKVQQIDTIHRRGAYAPVTDSGDIVVAGVLASSFVAILDHSPINQHFATHALLSPLRLLCSIDFGICENETYTNGYSNWIYYMMKATQFVNTCGPVLQTLVSLAALLVFTIIYTIVELLLSPAWLLGACVCVLIYRRRSVHTRA